MTRQSRGLEKEHELAKAVYHSTDGKIFPMRCGYSGNQTIPSPDLLIPFDGTLRAVELKTTSTDKLTITPANLHDLREWCINQTEVPTYAYLGVKFNRWVAYFDRLTRIGNPEVCFERFADNCPMTAYITGSGNLKIKKPVSGETDWQSNAAADSDTADADSLITALEKKTDEPSVTEIISQMNTFDF